MMRNFYGISLGKAKELCSAIGVNPKGRVAALSPMAISLLNNEGEREREDERERGGAEEEGG